MSDSSCSLGSHKALHEFLLQKFKEKTIEFTKKFKFKGNANRIYKLMQELTFIINKGGNNKDEMIRIGSQYVVDRGSYPMFSPGEN